MSDNQKIVGSQTSGEADNDVLFISETVVRRLLNWNDCVDAMESALVAMVRKIPDAEHPFSSQPPRTLTSVNNKGILFTMPGFAANYHLKPVNDERHSTLACKLVTAFGGNSQLTPPLPTILATILLFNAATGKLRAVIEGTEITAWRTASVSVVATKFLFRNHMNDEQKITLAVLGAGTQGRIHALAMLNYFTSKCFSRVKLWNRTRERAERLRDELSELFPDVEIVVASTSVDCVVDADVIVTATYSSEALFELKDLQKQNVHINAIGAGVNHYSEVAMDVYQNFDVFIESYVGIETELRGIEALVTGEVGEIIEGRKQLNLSSESGRKTLFQSMGNAVEDGIMANLICEKFIKL